MNSPGKTMRCLSILLFSFLIAACSEGIEVNLNKNDLNFKVNITGYAGKLENSLYKLNGTLNIHNNSKETVLFGNNELFLVISNIGESGVIKKHITNSSTGLRNVCTFPAKTRSKVANITTRGELGVMHKKEMKHG